MMSPLNVFDFDFQGHHLVEAAAGTGKTYSITSLYVRALVEKRLLPSQILVLTFTNDATAELKLRLRNRIQAILNYDAEQENEDFVVQLIGQLKQEQLEHLRNCLFHFDEASISTIHGFCQKILSEHHLEFNVSPGLALETDMFPLMQEAVDTFWDDFFFKSNPESDFEHWLLAQLNLTYQHPDKLLGLLKPLLFNSDIEIQPNLNSFDRFEQYFHNAKKAFLKIRSSYRSEKREFLEFYNSDALKLTSFKNKDKILSDFEGWLDQKYEWPTSFEKLHLFGEDMPHKHTKKGKSAPDLELFEYVQEYIACYESLLEVDLIFKSIAANRIRKITEDLKNLRGIIGYQDLLVLVKKGISKTKGLADKISKRFPVAFIDEFQDTDHIQYSIFNSIYADLENSCLVMIGDPKQAIYRFRGADIHTYLAASKRTKPDNKYSLSYNFRSSKKLIHCVNSIFKSEQNPFKTDGLEFEPAKFPIERNDITISGNSEKGTPLTLINFEKGKRPIANIRIEIAHSVAYESVQLLQGDFKIDDERIEPKDITVLVDTHKNAELIQDVLWKFGLRSIIRSKTSVFKTDEADQMFRILNAFAHPYSDGFIKSALVTDFFSFDASKILAFQQKEDEWIDIEKSFLEINKEWSVKGLNVVFRSLEHDFEILKHLAHSRNPERSITNYKHLKELLLQAERNNSYSILGLTRYFNNKREEAPNHAPDEEIIRLESDEDLIQIVTHHACKGLQYKIVFCPFLWNFQVKKPAIPIKSDGLSQIGFLNNKSDEFLDCQRSNKIDDEAEKVRLVYVALTRAEAMCYIYHNGQNTKQGAAQFNAIDYLLTNNKAVQELIIGDGFVYEKEIEAEIIFYKSKEKELVKTLNTQAFKRNDLNEFNRMFSFSSLAHQHETDLSDEFFGFDNDDDTRVVTKLPVQNYDNFSLPRGKDTGNLLHNIFEQITFTDSSTFETVIDGQMKAFEFNPEWKACISRLINNSVNHTLVDGLSLSKIKNSDRLVEMEFNFPVNQLDTKKLFNAIGLSHNSSTADLKGFMKGFIDLVLRKNGKYYILDYKSNHLGDEYNSYSNNDLSLEMKNANYILQYHIYLLAFLRFIRLKKPTFNYETEFGGVIYLFLRGVNTDEPGSGVYFNKPDAEVLHKIDQLMGEFVN